MKTKKNIIMLLLIVILMLLNLSLYSQNNSVYCPAVYKKAYENGTRSYDGKPGKKYWTNRSEYNIKASLNPVNKKLTGSEETTYYNNSPDTLKMLVLKTWQDSYKRESPRDNSLNINQLTDGMNLAMVSVNGNKQDLNNRRQIVRYGTNLVIRLKPDLFLAPGKFIKVNIDWDYTLAVNGIREGAYTDSSFFAGYWYPQMAVYDDIFGWDFNVYTGGQETYNDLADYIVEITLPSNYIVWATGDLQNEKDIFNEKIYDRIEESRKSKEIVKILTQDDYKHKIIKGEGNIVWKYQAKHVPDFAFASSCYYLWNATTANSDPVNGKTVWVNTIYPPTAEQFKNAITFAKRGIEFLSTTFPGIPYLYDKHYSFNGHRQIAMEYPMMANNCDNAAEDYIYEITVHEIAHGYLPFYVNSNEEEYAWMDEGFVKLFGEMALEQKGVKRPDSKYLNTINIYKNLAASIYDVPLMTPSSSINPRYDFATSYAKSANALYYLIQIMTEKGINNPIKSFLETWKDKHPTPYDFFFFMNSLAGEDLSWYWKSWYFEFASPDLKIKEVKHDSKGSKVIIENTGGLPMPLSLKITFADNTFETINKSPLIWKNGGIYTLNISGQKKVASVLLGDPYVVDVDLENNYYKMK